MLEINLFEVFKASCRIMRGFVDKATSGTLTVDDWRNALGAPILGMTWHYCDEQWALRSVPIASINMSTCRKTVSQLCEIMEEILAQSEIVGSDDVSSFTVTTDNEGAAALSADILTNFVGSVRCVVHSLALCVNAVFKQTTAWQKLMDHVNKVTTYFNHHQKAAQLLIELQKEKNVPNDRIQKLKHDIPTRWHSRLSAMLVYLCRSDTLSKVAQKLGISETDLRLLSSDDIESMSQIVVVLAEVRRVARELESDRRVTMSRTPRYLHELYETLMVMSKRYRLFTRKDNRRRSSVLQSRRGNTLPETIETSNKYCESRS